MTVYQLVGITAFAIFGYVSYLQWNTLRQFKAVIQKFRENSEKLTEIIERESLVLTAKEEETQSMRDIIKELDAEIAFHKCKKEGV